MFVTPADIFKAGEANNYGLILNMTKSKLDSTKNALVIYLEDKHRMRVQSQFSDSVEASDVMTLYQAFIEDTIAACLTVDNAELLVIYSSERAKRFVLEAIENLKSTLKGKCRSRLENDDIELVQQTEGEISSDFEITFKRCFEAGYTNVVLIDCVTPTINKRMLENAFKVLKKKDVVFGPTLEGSYYLLGMRKLVPQVFRLVEWSNTENIYRHMVEVARDTQLNWEELELWYDLRQPGDLEFLVRDINAFRIIGDETSAKATEAVLESLLQKLQDEEP